MLCKLEEDEEFADQSGKPVGKVRTRAGLLPEC